MAIIDWPTSRAFQGARWQMGLDVSESTYQGFHTGNRTRRSHLADRLRGVLQLPPVRAAADAAAREAFLMQLRSNGDWLRMGLPHRLANNGSLRGAPVVAATALAGSRVLALSGCTAGASILPGRMVIDRTLGAADFTLAACTLAASSELGPSGAAGVLVMTKTASGDSRAYHVYTTTTHARRTAIGTVWLKRGTQTGDVALRIRDGADTIIAEQVINITTSWAQYQVVGLVGASPAANLRFDINPTDDSVSVGGTVFLWQPVLQVTRAIHINARSDPSADAPPDGFAEAPHLLTRIATGDHYKTTTVDGVASGGLTWTYSAWLKSGTLTGTVQLVLYNAAGSMQGIVTVTPGATWQRFSVTATFAGGSVGVAGMVNPTNNTGTAGETLGVFGEQLELGSAPSSYEGAASLLPGDALGLGGNLLPVGYAGSTANLAGEMVVPLSLPLQKQATAGAVLVSSGATGLWELDDEGLTLDYSPASVQEGVAIPLRQVVA